MVWEWDYSFAQTSTNHYTRCGCGSLLEGKHGLSSCCGPSGVVQVPDCEARLESLKRAVSHGLLNGKNNLIVDLELLAVLFERDPAA